MRFLMMTFAAVMMSLAGAMAQDADGQKISEAWLALVDTRSYGESWTAAHPQFQKSIAQKDWAAAAAKVREPLGAVTSRTVDKVTNTKSLPGLPDGDYTVIAFKTGFANKTSATETITLIPDNGVPKVAGYFIN